MRKRERLIAALASTGVIARTVLLVDRTTDRAFMDEILADATHGTRGAARILDVSKDFSEGSLMAALLEGASIYPVATAPVAQAV